jgi:hypothetical protein
MALPNGRAMLMRSGFAFLDIVEPVFQGTIEVSEYLE